MCWVVINCKLIIKRLQDVQHNSVSLIWIPGHQGIVGNEKADALAKQDIHLTQNSTFCISIKDIIAHRIRASTPSTTKPLSPWFLQVRNTKEEISIINKLLLNIALTPAFLFKIRQREHPNCACGAVGSVNHIILSCPHFTAERSYIYQEILKLPYFGPWSIQSLIDKNKHTWGIFLKRYLEKYKMKL